MKKLIILFVFIFILTMDSNKETIAVFSEKIENTNYYEITFINNVSTNNFLKYFNDIKVIWIKPQMNLLYKNKLNKYNKYYFKYDSNDKNISKFKTEYISYIKNLGYNNEALKLQTSGIMLEKVKVYLNLDELNHIKSILKDIKIENVE